MAKLKELRRTLDAGLPPPDARLTVGAFLDRWVGNLSGRVQTKTAADYADTVRLHLKPALGRRLLTKLTVADVDALWAAKREAGYRPNSIRIMRAVLRAALRQAEREGLVLRNAAELSAPPKVPRSRSRSLTVDQARALLEVVRGDRLEACFALTLAFGLRRSEVLGLGWSDVDLDGARMAIHQGLTRVREMRDGKPGRSRLVLGELKTKGSRRTLPLTPPLVEALRAHRARQAAERLAMGPVWSDAGLVFTTPIGTPIDPDNFRRTFDQLCKRAGLGHWHPHELRHSGASIMLAQGVDLWIVSEVLGHSSVAITKDVYGHLLGGEKRSAAEAITGALFDRLAPTNGSHTDESGEDERRAER